MSRSRALIVQTGYLGDLVLTLPLARALAAEGVAIDLVVRRGLGALVQPQSYVDGIYELDKRGGWLRRRSEDRACLRWIASRGATLAIAAHRSFRSGKFVRAAAVERVGFAGSAGRWGLTRRVAYVETQPAAERFLSLVDGSKAALELPWLELQADAQERWRRLAQERGVDLARPYMTIAPGSVWATKRWTAEGFRQVAERYIDAGEQLLLIGSDAERKLASEIGCGIDLVGQTDLPLLVELLRGASGLIGNDSGAGHVAAAVGTAVTTIFGPTDPRYGFAPVGTQHRAVALSGLDCRPCSRHGSQRCPLKHHACMNDLSATQVLDALSPDVAPGKLRAHALGRSSPA